MSPDKTRDCAAIFNELHQITTRMMEKCDDSDFLVQSIEERQKLFDEYDRFSKENPDAKAAFERSDNGKKLAKKILDMDRVVFKALQDFRAQAKSDVKDSNAKQRVLSYTNQAISSSGSYMDFKK